MANTTKVKKQSSGLRSKRNAEREARRQARLAARKAAGKGYEYKPIAAKEGSPEYVAEVNKRARKNVNHKTPYATWVSIMRKLQNELDKKEAMRRAANE